MIRPNDLLECVLSEIENNLKCVNTEALSAKFYISPTHLRRLFKFAFDLSIGSYIRSRKLSASINDLLNTKENILDIALEYGLDYEQSYIRAFKREFGLTPGEFRKTGQIVKVNPPLQLFNSNKIADGLIFGPDIVIIPQFHIIGKTHKIPFDDSLTLAPKAAIQFWENERRQIKNVINPNVYIGFTCNIDVEAGFSEYITAVQVEDRKNIHPGLNKYTFDSSLCARFRYIGQHHYYDLNRNIAKEMYSKICNFENEAESKYALLNNKVYFEKVDTEQYDGTYCQMEWFSPVTEKTNMNM